jgi:putative endonuclease
MNHFVYIIYSQDFNTYYKGYSLDPLQRLAEHNANKSTFTARKGPWVLVHLEVFSNKSMALKRECRFEKI